MPSDNRHAVPRRLLLRSLAAAPLVAAAWPALAQLSDEDIQNQPSDGVWRAGAYVRVSPGANVTVRLDDDAPEYLKVRNALTNTLRDSGWGRPGGTPLLLAVRIETRRAVEKPRGGGERGMFLGRMALYLTDMSGKQRYWDAEAIWRPFGGEIAPGAEAFVPFLVARLGQTVELESVTLY